jgi:hypothetical protein
VKCFGERPACTRCVRKDEICIYDAAEGVSRQQDLRTRLQSVEAELGQMRAFIHSLQHSSNRDAATLLRRLRLGEAVADLVNTTTPHSVRYLPFLLVYQPAILTFEGGHLRRITRMTMVHPHKLRLLSRSKRKQHHDSTHQSTLLPINLGKMRTCCLLLSVKSDRLLPSTSLSSMHAIQRTRRCLPRWAMISTPELIKMGPPRHGANEHSR